MKGDVVEALDVRGWWWWIKKEVLVEEVLKKADVREMDGKWSNCDGLESIMF